MTRRKRSPSKRKSPASKSNGLKPIRFRFDFVFERLSFDEATRQIRFVAKPNPKRYEWRTKNGKKYLYDKFDDVYFPESILAKFAKDMLGQEMTFESQKIGDAIAYIRSRRPFILSMLKGEQPTPTFADPSNEFLVGHQADRLEFAILSLDIVGSTKLANTMAPSDYSKLVDTVIFELSEVIPLFNGHVLKYTGDGLIAYFPAPSFIRKNDLALDCALTLRALVYKGLNPALKAVPYPPIDVRIGLDSGEAAIRVVGSPATKQQKDLVGDVVSLACKIQGKAPVGGVALGDVTYRNLHTDWRTLCAELPLGADWTYVDRETGERYRVHEVKAIASERSED